MNKKIFIVLGILFFIGSVSALGITPAKTSVDFASGAAKSFSFMVVNSEHKEMNLVVFAQGELNKSAVIRKNMIYLDADEETKQINFEIVLPSELKPGSHSAEIVVLEIAETNSGVGAVVGVAHQISVYVPYPGKYAEAEFYVFNEDGIRFVIPVVSRGKLDLVNVKANIDIYNKLGEKIDSLNTNSVEIPSGKRKELVYAWEKEVSSGSYLAKATVIYDGETFNLERAFDVGEMNLELQQIEVNDFKLGGIAKFEMLVENKWSGEITNVYTQTKVFNKENEVMADFKSPTENIPALAKSVLISYWDTGGVKEGNYDASVYLNYGEKSEQKDLKLEVSKNSLEIIGLGYIISERKLLEDKDKLMVILISVIVVLVLINLAWFVFLRKKLFNPRENLQSLDWSYLLSIFSGLTKPRTNRALKCAVKRKGFVMFGGKRKI